MGPRRRAPKEDPSKKQDSSKKPPVTKRPGDRAVAFIFAAVVASLAVFLGTRYQSQTQQSTDPAPEDVSSPLPGGVSVGIARRLPLSPENVAAICAEARKAGPEPDEEVRARMAPYFDREAAVAKAKAFGEQGDFAQAAEVLTDAMQHDPSDTEARRMLHLCYRQMYPNKRFDMSKNFTRLVLTRLQRSAASKESIKISSLLPSNASPLELHVVQVSTTPPVFVVEGLFTDEECDQLVVEHDRRLQFYSQNGRFPVMCFKHDLYFKHPRIRPSIRAHSRNSRSGARSASRPEMVERYCLDQQASRIVNERIDDRRSTSMFVANHQSALIDSLRERMGDVLGLDPKHAYPWQMLQYSAGAEYRDHTDCGRQRSWPEDRMATFLLPLLDDFEGGETVFPKAEPPLSLKVRRGSGIVFWNFGRTGKGKPHCDQHSRHVANEVRKGRKLMVQQWFSYQEDAFRTQSPEPGKENTWLLPYQPWVSCDYVDGGGAGEISCRWYNDNPLDGG